MTTESTGRTEPVPAIVRHVRTFLSDHGIQYETPLVVACSGGLDSVVLTHAVVSGGFRNVTIGHVDHGIRSAAEAGADKEIIEELARWLGISFHIRTVESGIILTEESNNGDSIEAIARRHRYRELQYTLRTIGGLPEPVLLTAHHDDDVAETVLMRILSGRSPLEPLGIDADVVLEGMRVARPLIGVGRKTILDYARDTDLSWRQDSTNDDTRYLRNFVRQKIVPILRSRFSAIIPDLARFHREHRELRHAVEQLIPTGAWGDVDDTGEWSVSRETIIQLPPAAQEMVLRCAHKEIVPGTRSTFRPLIRAVRKLLEMDAETAGRNTDRVGGVEITVTTDALKIRTRVVRSEESGYLLEVSEGGCIRFQSGMLPTTAAVEDVSSGKKPCYLTPLVPPVVVRPVRAGDRLMENGALRSWKELFGSAATQSASWNGHIIEDMRGTAAMIRSSGQWKTRDGVTTRQSSSTDGHSVCVQFKD